MSQQSQQHKPKPPQPPKFNPKFQMYLYQWIGMPLIFLIPILALVGVFGVTTTTVHEANPGVAVDVEYPTRFRYKMIGTILVKITNTSDAAISTLTVSFDQDYIEDFSQVAFTPSVSKVTDDRYEVELQDIQPGETRVVNVGIQAEQYGEHEGVVTVSTDSGEITVPLVTFTFP